MVIILTRDSLLLVAGTKQYKHIMNINNLLLDITSFNAILSSILVITSKNPVISVIYLISLFLNASLFLILKGIYFLGISYILIYIGAITVLFLFVIMMINIKLTDILESGSQYTKNIPLALSVSGLFLYEIYNVLPFTQSGAWSGNNDILDLLLTFNEYVLSFTNTLLFNPSNTYAGVTSSIQGNLELINHIDSFFLLGSTHAKGELLTDTVLSIPNWADTLVISYTQIVGVAYSLYTYGAFWFLMTSIILLLAMVAPIYLSGSKSSRLQSATI